MIKRASGKDRLNQLKKQLKRHQKRWKLLKKEWSRASRGRRYGDEYLDTQMQVYESMIYRLKKQILDEKQRSGKDEKD